MSRIYLSPPHMGGGELELIQQAFQSNWIAPVGPHLKSFEEEFSACVGSAHAAALCSGTAALHLALKILGISTGDAVLCSTLTFVASANPILYEGAIPVFVDSDRDTWNMDPSLLAEELDTSARKGKRPKAVVLVHLYGQSADVDPIRASCARHGVLLIEDAAEALGASYKGRSPGTFGAAGVFSFNGNKIITTSGGGMLVSEDRALIERAKFLATQARDPAPHYAHSTMGYNYRLSNVLAGIGRGQLRVLKDRVGSRRRNYEFYRSALGNVPGLSFMPEGSKGVSTRWLTVLQVDPKLFGVDRRRIQEQLESRDIESRPVWKPLHLQPLFAGARTVGGEVSEELFDRGLCLPSGSQMTEEDLSRVVDAVLETSRRP